MTDTELMQSYVDEFQKLVGALDTAALNGFEKVRHAAFERFHTAGFPARKNEDWKYTPLTSFLKQPFEHATGLPATLPTADDVRAATRMAPPAHELVFIDGFLCPPLSTGSLPAGVTVGSLASALASGAIAASTLSDGLASASVFPALNTAFLTEGALIAAAANAESTEPLHLVFLSTAGDRPRMSAPRVVVTLAPRASLTLVEHHASLGEGMHFSNPVVQVTAGEGARFDHYRVQDENRRAFHISTLEMRLARDVRAASQTFTFGGTLVRNDTRALLDGENIACMLNGLTMADGDQHVDHQTLIDHAKPHCTSTELFKNILKDTAHGVFSGRIIVRPDAQKTDARQAGNALLLSPTANIDTRPQLEIFADDVRCSHGATVGRLDEESLFYLRSRGISRADAVTVLTFAFASALVDHVGPAALAAMLDARIRNRFPSTT